MSAFGPPLYPLNIAWGKMGALGSLSSMGDIRDSVGQILEPLVSEFADPPVGVTEQQLEQLREMTGLAELPAAVDEYMRLVGADEGLTAELYAGESRFEIGRILEQRDWKAWPLKLGIAAESLERSIPYSGTAEHSSWLTAGDCANLVNDPVINYVVEDGAQGEAGTFTEDLARRVPFARENLYWLRREIDDDIWGRAVVQAEFDTPEFHEQVEERLTFFRQTYMDAGMEPPSASDRRDDKIRRRNMELRRRLKS